MKLEKNLNGKRVINIIPHDALSDIRATVALYLFLLIFFLNVVYTVYQMRKVNVDKFIVMNIDAFKSGDVISRRRCPVNNFQYPIIP